MRDLAKHLIDCEEFAGNTSEHSESATIRVYEKLRQSLSAFAGVAGFQSLANRALTLAKTEAPSLSALRITEDGSLQGLSEIQNHFTKDNDQAGEGGIILIARLLGLLRIFLGEALTLSLLRVTWPGAAFDDQNSAHGRKT